MTRYRTIVADPPWHYDTFVSIHPIEIHRPHTRDAYQVPRGGEVNVRPLPYKSMSVDEICALPIEHLLAPDAALFLWAPGRYLSSAFTVLTSWDFTFKQLIVWHKSNPSPFGGSVAPNSAEFLLAATRGAHRWHGRAANSVIRCARPKTAGATYTRADHSRKPDAFLDLVEQVSPGPYLELFARRQRLGWDTWGDEALEHVSLAAALDDEAAL